MCVLHEIAIRTSQNCYLFYYYNAAHSSNVHAHHTWNKYFGTTKKAKLYQAFQTMLAWYTKFAEYVFSTKIACFTYCFHSWCQLGIPQQEIKHCGTFLLPFIACSLVDSHIRPCRLPFLMLVILARVTFMQGFLNPFIIQPILKLFTSYYA